MSSAPVLETLLSRRLSILEELSPDCLNGHTRVHFRTLQAERRPVQFAVLPAAEVRQGIDTLLESRGYDGIAIRDPSDLNVAERPDFHLVPEWIRWLMPCPASPQAWIDGLPGSDLRNQMRRKLRASDSLRAATAPLTLADYQTWYQQLYVPEVLSKSGAIPAWPEVGGLGNKLKVPLPIEADATVVPGMMRIFMYDADEQLVGGLLVCVDASDQTLRIRAAGYEATSRANRELAVRGMQELINLGNLLKCPHLSYGDDPNLYGVDVTAGLARFKASVGMRPIPSPTMGKLQLLKIFAAATRRLAEDSGETEPSGVLCFAIAQRGATEISRGLQIGAGSHAPAAKLPKGIPLVRLDRPTVAQLRLAG